MKPKVSVIIPCYNAEKTIGKTLLSLKSQTFKDFETIVVDDGSIDSSGEVIKNYQVKLISSYKNNGISFSRNKGIKAANGDFLLFLDADCQAEPRWIEEIYSELCQKEVGVVVGKIKVPASTFFANAVAELGFPGGANASFENMWRVSKDGFTDHIASGNFGVKKHILESVAGFDESLKRGEDAYLSFLLSKNSIKIKYCPDAVISHEPLSSFRQFVHWHISRGKANYNFRKKVGPVGKFVSLRLWSSKNILKKNLSAKFPLVFSLLLLSFILQQLGYLSESFKKW